MQRRRAPGCQWTVAWAGRNIHCDLESGHAGPHHNDDLDYYWPEQQLEIGGAKLSSIEAIEKVLEGLDGRCLDTAEERHVMATALADTIDNDNLYRCVEEDLAIAWAMARCKDCQEGECDLMWDDHDLSGYYAQEDTIRYVQRMNKALYGEASVFSQEEQEAMSRGYTRSERMAISGQVYGIYPQAISAEHAAKLNILNAELST